jgi:hypothetical protein
MAIRNGVENGKAEATEIGAWGVWITIPKDTTIKRSACQRTRLRKACLSIAFGDAARLAPLTHA